MINFKYLKSSSSQIEYGTKSVIMNFSKIVLHADSSLSDLKFYFHFWQNITGVGQNNLGWEYIQIFYDTHFHVLIVQEFVNLGPKDVSGQ